MPSTAAQREALAEKSARYGRNRQLLRELRCLTVQELSASPYLCVYAIDLSSELSALETVLEQSVRRRKGWLRFTLESQPLPAALPARLLSALLFSAVDGMMAEHPQTPFLLDCSRLCNAALIQIHCAGHSHETIQLLLQAARVSGGQMILNTSGQQNRLSAALRLPLRPDLPLYPVTQPHDILENRYSMLYQFLGHNPNLLA